MFKSSKGVEHIILKTPKSTKTFRVEFEKRMCIAIADIGCKVNLFYKMLIDNFAQ